MAKPVITPTNSPRRVAQGAEFTLALAASNAPDSWAATGLPAGLAIDEETGVVSGTLLTSVLTTAIFTATNGDGTSDPVSVIFVVEATPPGAGGPWDIEVDFDVITGEVTIPLLETEEGAALFNAPRGTNRFLLVGFLKRGVLYDINPEDEPVAVKLALKELEPERLIELTAGTTSKQGDAPDLTRYRIPLRITPSNWTGVLSDYETDGGTRVPAKAELSATVGVVADLYEEAESDSGIALQGNIISAITGDLVFTEAEEFAVSTRCRLTISLAVAGRALQSVQLVREFDVIFSGGVFVISNLSGVITGQGAVEAAKWRATLNLVSIVGGAADITANYSLTTTADGTIPKDYVDFSESLTLTDPGAGMESEVAVGAGYVMQLWDGNDEMYSIHLGTMTPDATYPSVNNFLEAIASLWEAITGATDVFAVVALSLEPLVIRIQLEGSVVQYIRWDETPSEFVPVNPASPTGAATTGAVSAELVQLTSPAAVPLNLTSEIFRVGVPRDMVPD